MYAYAADSMQKRVLAPVLPMITPLSPSSTPVLRVLIRLSGPSLYEFIYTLRYAKLRRGFRRFAIRALTRYAVRSGLGWCVRDMPFPSSIHSGGRCSSLGSTPRPNGCCARACCVCARVLVPPCKRTT